MRHEMDHERCSELLGPYARGELDAEERARVAAHLAGCSECSAELAGLTELIDIEVAPLTDAERSALRAGIERRLEPRDEVVAFPTSSERRALWGRLAPALGAAALILVVGVGAFWVGDRFTGQDEAAEDAGGDAEVAAEGTEDVEGPLPEFEGVATGEAAAAQEDQATGRRALTDRAFEVTEPLLRLLGERGTPFVDFAGHYEAPLPEDLAARFAALLGEAAGDDLRARIEECASEVISGRGATTLPAYGARGRFQERDALILGFASADGAEGPLDRYVFFVFPVDSCATPLTTAGGRIRS